MHGRIKASEVKDAGALLANQHVAQSVAHSAVILQGGCALRRDVLAHRVRRQELEIQARLVVRMRL